MIILMGTAFAGYTILSYGWVLTKGYNITFGQWVSPLHAYQWPAKGQDVPRVPSGRVFPTHTA